MSETLITALIGALIGGGFVLLGGVIQHFLSLREDEIKREREEAQKARDALRQALLPSPRNSSEASIIKSITVGNIDYQDYELELPRGSSLLTRLFDLVRRHSNKSEAAIIESLRANRIIDTMVMELARSSITEALLTRLIDLAIKIYRNSSERAKPEELASTIANLHFEAEAIWPDDTLAEREARLAVIEKALVQLLLEPDEIMPKPNGKTDKGEQDDPG